jgi:hypothetical protein
MEISRNFLTYSAGYHYLSVLRGKHGGSGSVTVKLEPVPPEQLPIIPHAYEVGLSATGLDKKDLGSSGISDKSGHNLTLHRSILYNPQSRQFALIQV